MSEYFVYARISHGGGAQGSRWFEAHEGDRLLVKQSELDGMAHVLNLVTGARALISWDVMAHAVKPAEDRREATA